MRSAAGLALALACAAAGSVSAQSLFEEQSWRGFTSDNKAFRPGDVLTVQVLENSSASSSADTGTRRSNRLEAELAHGSPSELSWREGTDGQKERRERTN